jgi:hypothetical protein
MGGLHHVRRLSRFPTGVGQDARRCITEPNDLSILDPHAVAKDIPRNALVLSSHVRTVHVRPYFFFSLSTSVCAARFSFCQSAQADALIVRMLRSA